VIEVGIFFGGVYRLLKFHCFARIQGKSL